MSLKEQADSRVGVAVISGGFAVLVAFITGLFNWLGNRPQGVESSPPALAMGAAPLQNASPVGPPMASLTSAQVAAGPAVAVVPEAVPIKEMVTPAPVDPRLSFSAFQAVMKNRDASFDLRQRTLERCLDQTVVWEGYVDERIKMAPDANAKWTVVLCENRELIEQSLFTMPAHCRFLEDPDGRVAALRRGQRVTIIGRFQDHNVVATEVVECTLSRVSDD